MATIPQPKRDNNFQKNGMGYAGNQNQTLNIQFQKIGRFPTFAPSSSSPFFERKHLQAIGCYLKRGFGNVRYRILRELGSSEYVCAAVELYYPKWCEGTVVGIPWSVVVRQQSGVRKEIARGDFFHHGGGGRVSRGRGMRSIPIMCEG